MDYKENKLLTGESFSKEKFASPSKEFGILPFWFVNGEMDYDEMERQIAELADKGMPGFIFHSRFGIKDYMPYLGKEWMDRYNFADKKAKEHGMQVWVYDEYNWPSGTCNQEIMEENPELTSRYLQLVINKIPGQFFTYMEGTDSRYNDLEQSEPIFACAILDENIENKKNEIVNLMPNIIFDKVISWEAPEGPWHLCYFIERQASWYSDVLNEETTQEFIRKTHEKYKDSVPGDISDSIVGFYTDEPAMHYFATGSDNYTIPWSSKMFKIFKDINGYDLKQRLPQLFFDIGDDYHKVRHDYWSALSKQYEKSYYGQIRKWCDDNNVIFTGHLLHEESLRAHLKSGGNLFHMLKNLHMTGVDHLYPRIGTRTMPEEHVAIKIASSVAHQNGSVRLICESMGGAYWDCTMERMKWIADWEYVLGVNILNPHGFHYSIEGERKRDWPPSQFYHHTWWKDYGRFNDYLKRIGFLMTGGHHVAKVGVIYPINSLWADFVPQKPDYISEMCQRDFEYITDSLLRIHYDFDYIDEDMMRKMTVRDGKICIEGEEYSLIILPPMNHIKEHTLGILKEFYDSGGKIIGDTVIPNNLIEPNGNVGLDVINEIFGDYGENTESFSLHRNKNENGGEAVVIKGPGLHKGDGIEIIREAVSSLIDWDVSIDNDDLFYLYRKKDMIPFYFIINPENKDIKAEISFRQKGQPKYYDLLSGEIKDIVEYRRDGDIVTFDWTFSPIGSAMFSFEEGEETPYAEKANFTVENVGENHVFGYIAEGEATAIHVCGDKKTNVSNNAVKAIAPINFGNDWTFNRSIDNALLIQDWKFAMARDNNKEFYKEDFSTEDWLDFTMGGWELQLPYEREDNTYPIDALYKAEFYADYIPNDIKLLVDGFKGKGYELYINGVYVEDKGEQSYLDSEIKQIWVKDYVKKGRNDIGIKITVEKKVQGLLDYIKIIGSFKVESLNGEERIIEEDNVMSTGSWTEQGYPYYSGTGGYTQVINIPDEYTDSKRLFLNIDCGKDVLDVEINGKSAGNIMWMPYELDITDYVVAGDNEITLKVTNTLINLLEAIKQPSGVFGASIHAYHEVAISIT